MSHSIRSYFEYGLTSEKKKHNELVKRFGRHPVYTDGALYYESACRIIGLEHHVYTFDSWIHTDKRQDSSTTKKQ